MQFVVHFLLISCHHYHYESHAYNGTNLFFSLIFMLWLLFLFEKSRYFQKKKFNYFPLYILKKKMFSSRSFTSNHLHLSSGGTSAQKRIFGYLYLDLAKKRFKTCWTSLHLAAITKSKNPKPGLLFTQSWSFTIPKGGII